jgi:hypothetical protein
MIKLWSKKLTQFPGAAGIRKESTGALKITTAI